MFINFPIFMARILLGEIGLIVLNIYHLVSGNVVRNNNPGIPMLGFLLKLAFKLAL